MKNSDVISCICKKFSPISLSIPMFVEIRSVNPVIADGRKNISSSIFHMIFSCVDDIVCFFTRYFSKTMKVRTTINDIIIIIGNFVLLLVFVCCCDFVCASVF